MEDRTSFQELSWGQKNGPWTAIDLDQRLTGSLMHQVELGSSTFQAESGMDKQRQRSERA